MTKKLPTIIWSPTAKQAYKDILATIIEKYGVPVAVEFDDKAEEILRNIQHFNQSYPKSKKKDFHKAVIYPRTSFIYQVSKNAIEIVAVLDNRSNHDY